MEVSAVRGRIARRVLVNLRIEPQAVQRLLPAQFRPKVVKGYAVGGICLIRLEQIRLPNMPASFGISSENAAHRFAIEWTDDAGMVRDGVYLARRDTNSLLNIAGQKLFPSALQKATFNIRDEGDRVSYSIHSADGVVDISLKVRVTEKLNTSVLFDTVDELSDFFQDGNIGFSPRNGTSAKLDAVRLSASTWDGVALEVEQFESTYFGPPNLPAGSFEVDSAFLMRDIEHSWLQEKERTSTACCS
jgi:hypothetical protein